MCGSADSYAEPRKRRGLGHNSNRRINTLPGSRVWPTRSLVIPARHELPELLTPDELAALLRTTRKAVYTMIARGQPPGIIRLGRRVLFDRGELLRWLAERRALSPMESRR